MHFTKKEANRYEEIYQHAVEEYLNAMEADVSEYVEEEEKAEYIILSLKINGECPFCGGSPNTDGLLDASMVCSCICPLCEKLEDEDGRCGCTNKDAR